MTKEEIAKKAFDEWIWIQNSDSNDLPTLQDIIESAMQEYADQETTEKNSEIESLKAELGKTIETAKATSVTQRQHIERLQNEKTEMFNLSNKIEQSRAELQKESVILFKNYTTAICDIIKLTASIKSYQQNRIHISELYKCCDRVLQKHMVSDFNSSAEDLLR